MKKLFFKILILTVVILYCISCDFSQVIDDYYHYTCLNLNTNEKITLTSTFLQTHVEVRGQAPQDGSVIIISMPEGLYKVNPDGTGFQQISNIPVRSFNVAKQGNKIVFVSLDYTLYTINIDGSALRLLSDKTIYITGISPNGTKVAYIDDKELHIINSDGTNDYLLISALTSYSRIISWNDTGTKILFSNKIDGEVNIYSVNIDGSGLTNLTTNFSDDAKYPVFSNNGQKILFVTYKYLYIMNHDGTNIQQLTTGDISNSCDVIWSPDDSKILFHDTGYEKTGTYLINPDGSGLKFISEYYASSWVGINKVLLLSHTWVERWE